MVSSPNKTTSSELKPPSTSKFSFTSPIHFNNNKMSPSKSGIPSPNKFNTLPTKSNNPSSNSTSTKLPTASMRSLRPRDRKGRVSTNNHSEPDQEGDDIQNQDHQQHVRIMSDAKGKTRERRKEKESELERGVRPESSLGKRRLPSQEDSDSDLDLNKDIESEIENDWKSEDEWNQNQNQDQDQMQRGEMLQGEDQDGDQTEGVDQFGRNTRTIVKSNENENVDTPTRARSKMSRLFPGKSTKTNNATRIPPSPSFSSKIRSPQSKVARQGSIMTDVHTSTSTSTTLPRLQKSGIPTSSSTFANPTSSVSSSSRPSPKHLVKSRANTLGWNAGGSKPRSRMSLGGAIPRSSISSNSFNPSTKKVPNERSRTTSNASINSINLDGGEGRNPSRNSLRSEATTTNSTLASENQSRAPRRRSSTDNLMNYDPYSGIGLGASENEKGGGHSRRLSSVGSVGGSNIASSMKSQEIPTLEKENKLPIQGGLVIKSGSSLKGPPSTFDSQHRSKPRLSIPGGPPNSFKAPTNQNSRKSTNSAPSNSASGTTPLSKPQQPSSSASSGNGSVKSRAKAWESSKSTDPKDKVANVRPSNPSLKNPISKIASTTPTSTPSKANRSNLPNPSPMRTPNSLIGRKVPTSASKPGGLSKLPSSRSLNQLRQDSEKAKQSLPTLPTPDARERGMRRLSGMGFNSNPSSKDSTPKDQDGNGTGGTKSALSGPVANLKNNNTKIKSSSPLKDSFTNNDDHSSPTPIIKIDSSSSHSNDEVETGKGKLISSPRKSEETRENLEDGLVEMLIKAGLDPSASEDFIHREVEKSRNSLSPSPAPKSSNVSQESSPAANSRRRRNSESIEKIVDGSWSTEQEEEEGGNQKGSDHLKTSHHQEETVGDTSEMNLLSPLSDMESRYNHLDTPDQEFRELEDEEEDNLNSPSVDALKRSRTEKASLNHDLGQPKSKSRLNRLRRLQNSSLNFDESFENVEDTSSLGLEMGEDENLMNQSIHFDGRMSTIGSGFLDEEVSPRDFKKASLKEDGALKEVDEEQLVEEKDSKILQLESKLEELQSQSQSENQEKESLALKLKEALHQIEQYKIQSEYDEQARHEISKSQESTVEEMEKLKVESFERIRNLKKEKEKEVSGFKKESCLIKWKEEGRRWKEVERLARIETTMMKNEMDMLVFLKKQAEDWAKMLGEVV